VIARLFDGNTRVGGKKKLSVTAETVTSDTAIWNDRRTFDAVLFVASLLLASTRPAEGLDEAAFVAWFESQGLAATTIAALYLAPFAGIAFLWFIGVIRHRIGAEEDQFFSTVFLGSGLLFVAMFWAAAASLASLVANNRFDIAPSLTAARLEDARSTAFSFLFVLAARAAAVFMITTCTIARRAPIFPPLLVVAGYALAVVMLLSLSFLQWIVLLFRRQEKKDL